MGKQMSLAEQKLHLAKMRSWGGILLLDKPIGLTSRHVDNKLKRHIDFKKLGHVGTLDPFASGLLPICIGFGTSMVPYIEEGTKSYLLHMHIGLATDTLDSQGKINPDFLNTKSKKGEEKLNLLAANDFARVREAISNLLAIKEQKPPIYSAVKYKGKALYDYARQGLKLVPEIKARPISIIKADLLAISYLKPGEKSILIQQAEATKEHKWENVSEEVLAHQKACPLIEAVIEFEVTKGTYIRSLCESVALELGLGAYAASLRRTACQDLHVAEALSLEAYLNLSPEEIRSRLLPLDSVLGKLEALFLDEDQTKRIIWGQTINFTKINGKQETKFRIYDQNRNFIGICKLENGKLKAERILI